MLLPLVSVAQAATPAPYKNERYLMVAFAIFLFIVIIVLGKVVQAFTKIKGEKWREKRKGNTTMLPFVFLLSTAALFSNGMYAAEEAVAEVAAEPFWLMTLPFDMVILFAVIILELIVILILVKVQWNLIQEDKVAVVTEVVEKDNWWAKFFAKVNNTVPLEEEHTLDLNHDYDGIRELDNKIPRWWMYSFLGTILISFIYMYRMFVSETLLDQEAELHQANIAAEIQMKDYLKNSANNVDENTVVMQDAAGIEAGKTVYSTMGCAACHGEQGEGNVVGPNLVDEYWIHKGSLKDIFYSIKYGWPEKGMKAWKDDMSPIQIAQLSSYLKSMQGSNPPNAKEPQGDKYTEDGGDAGGDKGTDSTKTEAPKVAINY